jgi:hypothetical protein
MNRFPAGAPRGKSAKTFRAGKGTGLPWFPIGHHGEGSDGKKSQGQNRRAVAAA